MELPEVVIYEPGQGAPVLVKTEVGMGGPGPPDPLYSRLYWHPTPEGIAFSFNELPFRAKRVGWADLYLVAHCFATNLCWSWESRVSDCTMRVEEKGGIDWVWRFGPWGAFLWRGEFELLLAAVHRHCRPLIFPTIKAWLQYAPAETS